MALGFAWRGLARVLAWHDRYDEVSLGSYFCADPLIIFEGTTAGGQTECEARCSDDPACMFYSFTRPTNNCRMSATCSKRSADTVTGCAASWLSLSFECAARVEHCSDKHFVLFFFFFARRSITIYRWKGFAPPWKTASNATCPKTIGSRLVGISRAACLQTLVRLFPVPVPPVLARASRWRVETLNTNTGADLAASARCLRHSI